MSRHSLFRNVIGHEGPGGGPSARLVKGLAAGLQRVLSPSDPVAVDDYHSFAGNQDVHLRVCDVSSLESVKAFAAEHERSGRPLHVLVNNAGILVCFHGVHPASFLHAFQIFFRVRVQPEVV